MAEAKPIASLSSTLLARKGHAKPAMRPQGFANFGFGAPHPAPDVVDDLGWNDMGGTAPVASPVAPVVAPPVAPPVADVVPINADAPPVSAPVEPPIVHRQREEIARGMAPAVGVAENHDAKATAVAVPEPVSEPTSAPVERRRDDRARDAVTIQVARVVAARAAPGTKAKAAFTLRLEAERHLKLRLAGAIAHRSSQAILVEALDAYLDALPRVAELAREAVLRAPAGPGTDTRDTDAPGTDTPSTDTPSTNTPSTNTPSTNTPSTNTPSTNTPSTNTPSTNTPSTNTKDKR